MWPAPTDAMFVQLEAVEDRLNQAWAAAKADPGRADELMAEVIESTGRISRVASMHLNLSGIAQATVEALTDAMDVRGDFVYHLWGADGDLLYIGSTSNLLARLGQHSSSWARDIVASVTVIRCRGRAEMLSIEGRLIAELRPPHNVRGIPAATELLQHMPSPTPSLRN